MMYDVTCTDQPDHATVSVPGCRHSPVKRRLPCAMAITQLLAAGATIEDLGGHLTAAQAAKAERADASRRRFAARMERLIRHIAEQPQRIEQASPPPSIGSGTVPRKQRKLGRNAPCWYGSSKKYKKCHLDLERS